MATPPKIISVRKLIEVLARRLPPDRIVWFRGQSNSRWDLRPSILRPPNSLESEFPAFKRFKQVAYPYLESRPEDDWDWLFLMQHYGIPTRLLDWTEDPLVALYFAVHDHPKNDGRFWALFPQDLNAVAGYRSNHRHDIPALSIDSCMANYAPARVLDVQTKAALPMAVLVPRKFRRIIAQKGVFVIYHRDNTSLEKVGTKKHVMQFDVPADKKDDIIHELRLLRINAESIYADIDKAAQSIKELFA